MFRLLSIADPMLFVPFNLLFFLPTNQRTVYNILGGEKHKPQELCPG
jgi:hypothetical protein